MGESRGIRRRLPRARWLLLPLALAALPAGAVLLWNGLTLDFDAFDAAAAALVARSEAVAERLERETPHEMLAALPPTDDWFFRLDDELAAAHPLGRPAGAAAPPPAELLALQFEGDDAVRLRARDVEAALGDGRLRVKGSADGYLESEGEIDFPATALGSLEIRARVRNGKMFRVGWSSDPDADVFDRRSVRWFYVNVQPDGELRTVRSDLRSPARGAAIGRARVRKIFVATPPRDTVEIDEIRFLSKWGRYAEAPVGVTFERTGGVYRRALYHWSPGTLAWDVDLPAEPAKLQLGAGVLDARHPVTFRVRVRVPAGETLVFEHDHPGAGWSDGSVDLSAFAGQRITLELEATSDGPNAAFWSSPTIYVPPRERLDAIVVLEDALRADHLSAYGYEHPTSPAKDALFARGVRFSHAFSQATKTRPSVPSFMTSLYPSATGVWNFGTRLGERHVTLAEALRSRGFATASFIQNPNAGPLFGVHQGFDTLIDANRLGGRAEQVYGPILARWLALHADRNVFVYLHLIDPHGPYDPPPGYGEPRSAATATPVEAGRPFEPEGVLEPTLEGRRARYDGEIAYNDDRFGKFWTMLQRSDRAEHALIAVIADHGEHLGEHGLWEHSPPGYIQVLRVPLLLHHPTRLPDGVTIDTPVGLIDLMPTILDLAGVDTDRLALQGRSLLPLLDDAGARSDPVPMVVSEEVVEQAPDALEPWGSVFHGSRHWLHSGWLRERLWTRAYDYVDDPAEERNDLRAAADPRVRGRVRALFRDLHGANTRIRSAVGDDDAPSTAIDPEDIKRLRALGYVN